MASVLAKREHPNEYAVLLGKCKEYSGAFVIFHRDRIHFLQMNNFNEKSLRTFAKKLYSDIDTASVSEANQTYLLKQLKTSNNVTSAYLMSY